MEFISKNKSVTGLESFRKVRDYSVTLCEPLQTEDYVPQPVAFASPPKWHLAHTSWFFEELLLKPFKKDYKEYNKDFSYLFNSYYNALGSRIMRHNRGLITRPTVEEVYQYRDYINQEVTDLLLDGELSEEAQEILTLGLNHEQQHQELLLTDLKHTLGHNPIFPTYKQDYYPTETLNLDSGFIKIEEGLYEIGYNGNDFCYDNELGRHKVFLHSYEISKSLVTNGEYLEFINDGGYKKAEYWHDDGWAWVKSEEVNAPLYWHKVDEKWKQYTLGGLIDLNSESILSHINFYEAAAFAEWKGMRLPTEQEWEVASELLNWGERWEWTNSAYLPYPGFEKASGAIGEYNGKFMINQMVLRGASVGTSPGHSRNTYRNFFHPHHRWQFTGIRLAK